MKVDTQIKMELDAAITAALANPLVIAELRESTETIVLEMVETVLRDRILKQVQQEIKSIIPIVITDLLGAGVPQKNLDTIIAIIDVESEREEVESR